ncbi:hypothetical protein ACWEQL_06030 [Kitasatospora sp. NPDC004240]
MNHAPTPPRDDDPPTHTHGYGVRFEPAARLYRVRNELTGEWKRDADGVLCGWTSFLKADAAWRAFQPRSSEVSGR